MTDPEYNIEVEQPINFTIYNDREDLRPLGAVSNIVLFGPGQFLDSTNYGSEAGVKIIPDYGVSYAQVMYDDLNSPFIIKSLRTQSFVNPIDINPIYRPTVVDNTSLQTTQPISAITNNIYGYSSLEVINTNDAVSPYQNQITIGELKQDITITPDTYLNFNLLYGVKIVFSVVVRRQVNIMKLKKMWRYYKAPSLGLEPFFVKK